MQPKKVPKNTTSTDIKEFLTKTGFILEMEVAELLTKSGYSVKPNQFFYDYDEEKKREIDIVATKDVNDISITLIIECKQSLVDNWVFICSDKKPSRYYQYIKHSPKAENIEKTRIFDSFPALDFSIRLAQNYIIRDKYKNKKSSSDQIETCIEKLPKALVDFVDSRKYKENKRSMYFPIAIFSDQIFIANYNKKLETKSVDMVQYKSSLESDSYKYHYNPTLLFPGEKDKKEKENSEIADTSRRLGYEYLIDFTTRKGLLELVSKLESEIRKIDLGLWPFKDSN